MRENDGIVDGESELQYNGDGIGDGRDLPQPEVRAHIEQRRNAKDNEEYDDFKIAARCEKKNRHNDERGKRHNADHLLRDLAEEVCADVRGGICIKSGGQRPDVLHGSNNVLVAAVAVKRDREQRRRIHEMRRRIVKCDAGHMVQRLDLFNHGARPLIGCVRKHDVGAGIRRKFVFHNRKPAAGIRIGREERRNVVVHSDAPDRERTVNAGGEKRDHNDHALIDDLLRYFFQNVVLLQERSPMLGYRLFRLSDITEKSNIF